MINHKLDEDVHDDNILMAEDTSWISAANFFMGRTFLETSLWDVLCRK